MAFIEFRDVSKIIIAQRSASVKDADKIIVLENGSISDMGTHTELLLSSEIYKDIYNSLLFTRELFTQHDK